ncbi:MAG: hypothetical protein LBN33_01680 [Desulfovibrio sp.]|jgi:hypothetical protein|nr:hypothetical protein [Desulfovibrio sp.]
MTNYLFKSLFCILLCLGLFCPPAQADAPPPPQGLGKLAKATDPHTVAESFLGIPYRVDGAIDDQGFFTLFADPARRFSSPGLNCSGLVLGMSRFLLQKNIPLQGVLRDRLGDSGPGAKLGEDWDFGWDLVMNISEGIPRTLLLPDFAVADPVAGSGIGPRGYDIHKPGSLEELGRRLRPGFLYLVSMSVEGRREGYPLSHYHVGLILVNGKGQAWFYQTTGRGGAANRRDLKSAAGRESFRKSFANGGDNRRMLLVVEVDLPARSGAD